MLTSFDWVQLVIVAVLAMAVATIALTLTKSSLFYTPRGWIIKKSNFFGELVVCPYCTSHWVAFVAVAIYQPRPIVTEWFYVDLVVSAFLLVGLASVCVGLIFNGVASTGEE